MATINVVIEVDDRELEGALKFLGANETTAAVMREELTSDIIRLDLRKITDPQKRYYHTNGLTAMMVSVQDDIKNSPCEE